MTRERLLKALDSVRPGLNEIMVHPGLADEDLYQRYPWGYSWEDELRALTDPRVLDRCKQGDFVLTDFGGGQKS
jgi:predicted glycoside hydrolase/deacetylase ChbG (UPF0249 family)